MIKFILASFSITLIASLLSVDDNYRVNALDNHNSTNITESIADALETSKVILENIGTFIHETLLPEAFEEGILILDNTKKYLADCENLLKNIENITEYYNCAKPELGKAMAALSALQSKYHLIQLQNMANNNNTGTTSGAAHLKLFW